MTAKTNPLPKVYINGSPIPLPRVLPIFGHDYLVVVVPNEEMFDDLGSLFSVIDHVLMEVRFQRDWTSAASFLAALVHEGNEGAKAHCDLSVSHEQLSVFAECLGPFLAAFIAAQ